MKDNKVYLASIIDSINKILEYTKDGQGAFLNNSMIQDAVIRNLEILGEATKNITTDLRDSKPDIPWRKMAGLRDVLIHDYLGIDVYIVWNVVQDELPELKVKIESLIN